MYKNVPVDSDKSKAKYTKTLELLTFRKYSELYVHYSSVFTGSNVLEMVTKRYCGGGLLSLKINIVADIEKTPLSSLKEMTAQCSDLEQSEQYQLLCQLAEM